MTVQLLQKAPKVSVLMTIYNAEPYLKEAIDSIVAQTFNDWELIAVENGSSDQSPAILAGYKDVRIRTFFMPANIGRTPALRYAFEQAQGEYIGVLDADDASHPERLEQQVHYLDEHSAVGLVGTWAEHINQRGEALGEFQPPTDIESLYDLLGLSNPFIHSSVMYRSLLARRLGGYPEECVFAQDYSLILRMAKCSRLGMIGRVLCRVRSRASNMTNHPTLRLIRAQEQLHLLREARAALSLSKIAMQHNHRRQAVAKLKIGLSLIGSMRVFDGTGHIISAIREDPGALIHNGCFMRLFKGER